MNTALAGLCKDKMKTVIQLAECPHRKNGVNADNL